MSRKAVIFLALSVTSVIVAGLTLVIQGWREAGRRTQCANNLRQLALGVVQYGANGEFPPAVVRTKSVPREQRLSWLVAVAPLADQFQGIQIFFDPNKPWSSRENLRPRCILYLEDEPNREIDSAELCRLPLGRCPGAPAISATRPSSWISYVGIAGLGADAATLPRSDRRAGVFGYERSARPDEVSDGLSTTMILTETELNNGPWIAGGPHTVRGIDPSRQPYIGKGRQFGGTHRAGAMVAFADASVRFVSETIDPRVFEAISTIAGGESIGSAWDR